MLARAWLFLLAAQFPLIGQISGTVHDPSGAPVARAAITLNQLTSATDAQGRFHFDNLAPGAYRLAVSIEGFDPYEQTIDFAAKPVSVSITLALASLKTSVTVSAGSLRNTDPNYQALRRGRLEQFWRVHDLVLHRDAATITFRSGGFSFLPPVLGRVAVAVFRGDGNLKLKPAFPLAAGYMKALTRSDSADEDFTSLAVYFTDSTYEEITAQAERTDESPKALQSVLDEIQTAARRRTNPPQSYLETLLGDDDVPNSEADILASLYNRQPGVFRAFLHGKRHPGLRFILDPRGALPVMPAPEEVALVNYNTSEDADGIWYLAHSLPELASGRARSTEDHRWMAPDRYLIDVNISAGLNFSAHCTLRFHTLSQPVRMARFQLLPELEASSVNLDGSAVPFVQESRRHDGSFYLQFPTALAANSTHEIAFTYGSAEYITETMAQRAYKIQPLRPWYPRVDAASRAFFDLTFHVPAGMTAVSVGRLARQAPGIFEWIADSPIPPAGFNYGLYHVDRQRDPRNGYLIESYLLNPKSVPVIVPGRPPAPDGIPLPNSGPTPNPGVIMSGPKVEAGYRSLAVRGVALDNARAAVELFENWYGGLPYGRLAVSESLYAGSLPGLLFLPPVILGGAPERGYASGAVARNARALDEAIPAISARQWLGALVSPASFHELWMTRGFSDFSAALFNEAAHDDAEVRGHWSASQFALMSQDYYGLKLREAPPVWWGLMTDIRSTVLGAYYHYVSDNLLARKGGYIFHMLRELMYDPETGDRDFIAMMRDFFSTYANRAASTEDFIATVNRHVKPQMILDRTGNMQWFFDEWVYGADIPSYSLEYSTAPAGHGQVKLSGTLAQSGVSPAFRMRARVYVRLGKRTIPAAYVLTVGNQTTTFEVTISEEPKEVLLNAQSDVLTEHQEVHRAK